MDYSLSQLLADWKINTYWLIGFFLSFGLLARCWACNAGQPIWRKDALTDLLYSFLMPLLTRVIRIAFLTLGVIVIFYGDSPGDIQRYLMHGYGPLAKIPLWLQAAVIFLVSDVILYWTHRWFHTREMWRFHAIHHSSQMVDWMSAYRFHPINIWLSFTLVDTVMILVGFSPEAITLMGAFNGIYSAMVHANLSWTFGPFKYIFASPVFHRWHHTAQEEGMNKNFAPTFPLIDIVFGTFYMPENTVPQRFGVPGSDIPSGFIGQMIWPFRNR